MLRRVARFMDKDTHSSIICNSEKTPQNQKYTYAHTYKKVEPNQ